MFRGLTIFTALLGVILLGVLVALQVQRSFDEDSTAPAGIEAGEEDLSNEVLDLGESEPLGFEEPFGSLQTEPDPTVDPPPTTSLDAAPPSNSTNFDSVVPPPIDSPPRSLSVDSTALPASRDAASLPPTASARSLPPIGPIGEDPIRPVESTFPTPPALELPALDAVPATAAAADDGSPGIANAPPATVSSAAPPRAITAADAVVPPTSESAPPALDSRVIDLPQPPALSGSDLPERPATITPDAARPAPAPNSTADPLVGIGTIDQQAPQGLQQPQLQITKTFPATGAIGEALIYTIRIRNAGLTTVHDVVLEDPIPQGAKLTGTVPQAELDSGRLSWLLGAMKPGSEHKIMVRVVPTRAGDLGSTATVRFASQAAATTRIAGPATAGNPTTTPAASGAAAGKIKQTGVSLDVTAPAEAEVGDVLTLKFTLTNHTKLPRSGIVLRNEIPAQLDHPAGTDLEYPLPTLAAGGSKVITLQVTAKSKGEAINRATLASGKTLIASDQHTIRIGTPQPLKLEQSVPAQASVGTSTSLKTVVTNTAATPSQAATVQQTLAPGLDFLSASGAGQYDPVNGRITWQLPSLQPGARATFTTTVRSRQIGKKLTSLVRLTSGTQTLATSSASLQTVGFAAPSMDITGVQAPAATGRAFDITYRLANRGTAAVTGGQLRISLPASLELIKVTGGTRLAADNSTDLVIAPKTATINGGDTQSIVVTLRAANAGQHLLQSSFACQELKQPLARTDAITTLPRVVSP